MNETSRYVSQLIELDDEVKFELSKKIKIFIENKDKFQKFSILHFIPDAHKKGGRYMQSISQIDKFDSIKNKITLSNKREIEIKNIIEIKGVKKES